MFRDIGAIDSKRNTSEKGEPCTVLMVPKVERRTHSVFMSLRHHSYDVIKATIRATIPHKPIQLKHKVW